MLGQNYQVQAYTNTNLLAVMVQVNGFLNTINKSNVTEIKVIPVGTAAATRYLATITYIF